MAKNEKIEKTNVCRVLDQKKIPYKMYTYDSDNFLSGLQVAESLGQDPRLVFKTLVTVGKSKTNYVFVIPVGEELDLKKAALAVGEKNIEMLPQKELLNLTGYIHGGCSPIGMKKFFKTTFHESVKELEQVIFSGGRVGWQVQVNPEDLKKAISYEAADIIVD